MPNVPRRVGRVVKAGAVEKLTMQRYGDLARSGSRAFGALGKVPEADSAAGS
jgi:hypothetical protein